VKQKAAVLPYLSHPALALAAVGFVCCALGQQAAVNLRAPLGPLGAIAEIQEGAAGELPAFKLHAITPLAPAALAGLKAGDVIHLGVQAGPQADTPLRRLIDAVVAAQTAPDAVKAGHAKLNFMLERDGRRSELVLKFPRTPAHSAECPLRCAACKAWVTISLDALAAQSKGYRPAPRFDLLDRGPYYTGKIVNGMMTAQSRTSTVVVTAVAGLAFLSAGETPLQGPHAATLAQLRDYVSRAMQTWQLPSEQVGGPIERSYDNWALGYAGLFLSECFASAPHDAAQRKLLEFIAKRLSENQEDSGGWAHHAHEVNILGYKELAAVALCVLPALCNIKARGVPVVEATLQKGLDYLKKLQESDGGYAYAHDRRGYTQVGRSAGVLHALLMSGAKTSEEPIKSAAGFVLDYAAYASSGHGSQMMNLAWSGWATALLGTQHASTCWMENRHLTWAARQPDGSFAPLPRREFGFNRGQLQELKPYDADTDEYLGKNEPKALDVWRAAHHLIFWLAAERNLSWMKVAAAAKK